VWIPAHMGFARNERADALARLASSENPITAEPHIGLSNRQVASALRDWALESQATQRQNPNGFSQKLRGLNRHFHLLGIYDIPVYSQCGTAEETSYHLLGVCHRWSSIRRRFLVASTLEWGRIRSLPSSGRQVVWVA